MIATLQPTTAAEVFANAAAVRKRLMSPQREPGALIAAIEPHSMVKMAKALHAPLKPRPLAVVMTPSWKLMEIQFDAHVIDMRVAFGEISLSPVDYLRRRCRAQRLEFDEIVGPGRTQAIVAARNPLILELKIAYPSLSLPQLGRIFGGRDHTTILHSLRKLGADHGAIRGATASRASEIEGLWLAGQTQQDIAITLGLTQSAVSRFIKRQGWTR